MVRVKDIVADLLAAYRQTAKLHFFDVATCPILFARGISSAKSSPLARQIVIVRIHKDAGLDRAHPLKLARFNRLRSTRSHSIWRTMAPPRTERITRPSAPVVAVSSDIQNYLWQPLNESRHRYVASRWAGGAARIIRSATLSSGLGQPLWKLGSVMPAAPQSKAEEPRSTT